MIFIWISKFLRLFFAFVSKIKPQDMDNKAITIRTALAINVGKRGTRPVLRNSVRIGINITTEIKTKIKETRPKKCKGL